MDLRREWWLNHGAKCCPYGDDGEMSCCGLDFKRWPLELLRERVTELRWKSLAEAVAASQPVPPSDDWHRDGHSTWSLR